MVIAVGYEKDGVSSKSTVRDETVKLQLLLLKVSVTVGCALSGLGRARATVAT